MQKKRFQLSLEIVHCDGFVDLPAAAQALYLQIVSVCDDEGFTSQLTMCKLFAHASEQDVQELVDKEFLFLVGDGPRKVAVVKHWWMNTYIRDGKVVPSTFTERNKVYIKPNGNYTLDPTKGQPLPPLTNGKMPQSPSKFAPSANQVRNSTASREAPAQARHPNTSQYIPLHSKGENDNNKGDVEEKEEDDKQDGIGACTDKIIARLISYGFLEGNPQPKWRTLIESCVAEHGYYSTSESVNYILSKHGLTEQSGVPELVKIYSSDGMEILNRYAYFAVAMGNSFKNKNRKTDIESMVDKINGLSEDGDYDEIFKNREETEDEEE